MLVNLKGGGGGGGGGTIITNMRCCIIKCSLIDSLAAVTKCQRASGKILTIEIISSSSFSSSIK